MTASLLLFSWHVYIYIYVCVYVPLQSKIPGCIESEQPYGDGRTDLYSLGILN